MSDKVAIIFSGMLACCTYLTEKQFMEMYEENKEDLEFLGYGLDDGLFAGAVKNVKTGECYTTERDFNFDILVYGKDK